LKAFTVTETTYAVNCIIFSRLIDKIDPTAFHCLQESLALWLGWHVAMLISSLRVLAGWNHYPRAPFHFKGMRQQDYKAIQSLGNGELSNLVMLETERAPSTLI